MSNQMTKHITISDELAGMTLDCIEDQLADLEKWSEERAGKNYLEISGVRAFVAMIRVNNGFVRKCTNCSQENAIEGTKLCEFCTPI